MADDHHGAPPESAPDTTDDPRIVALLRRREANARECFKSMVVATLDEARAHDSRCQAFLAIHPPEHMREIVERGWRDRMGRCLAKLRDLDPAAQVFEFDEFITLIRSTTSATEAPATVRTEASNALIAVDEPTATREDLINAVREAGGTESVDVAAEQHAAEARGWFHAEIERRPESERPMLRLVCGDDDPIAARRKLRMLVVRQDRLGFGSDVAQAQRVEAIEDGIRELRRRPEFGAPDLHARAKPIAARIVDELVATDERWKDRLDVDRVAAMLVKSADREHDLGATNHGPAHILAELELRCGLATGTIEKATRSHRAAVRRVRSRLLGAEPEERPKRRANRPRRN
jgi:hypothetical protein